MKAYTIPANKPLFVWHYLNADYTTALGGIPTKVGETYSVVLPLAICKNGLHASRHPMDALCYSSGPVVTLCEVWGKVIEVDDKICAQFRRPLWAKDSTPELHEFACRCAEAALGIAEVRDERSWEAIEAKRAWLRGEINDEQLAAARDAAWAAAWAAARDAAWAAALAAARDAAWAAARSAARAAARSAARDAALAAARDAARDAFQQDLLDLLPEELRSRYLEQ